MDCVAGILGCLCIGGVRARSKLEAGGVRRCRKTGPLAGVKILDLSQVVSGPFGTRILADLGAEVIKIESLTQPDSARGLGASPAMGMGSMYMSANMGKRSIVLDLSKPEGCKVVARLVKSADVVLQNFRPGVVERMGIGYEALKQANPELIYVNLSGFGRTGPMAGSRVYDPIIQASSGFCEHNADEEGARLTSQLMMDKVASITVAQTILAALVAKDRGAGGQEVNMTMLDAGVNFIWPEVFGEQTWGMPVVPVGPQPHSFYRMWNTVDAVGALALSLSTDQDWQNFAVAFGKPELASDSRFSDGQKREANVEAWTLEVQEILNDLPLEEALTRATAAGVPATRARTEAEVLCDPQLQANGTFQAGKHLLFGAYKVPKFPGTFSGTPLTPVATAPFVGEQTIKILAEAGYSTKEAAKMIGEGVATSTSSLLIKKEGPKSKKAKIFNILDKLQAVGAPNLWGAKSPQVLSQPGSGEAGAEAMKTGGPLAGIQVLEFSRGGISAAFAGAILSDMGAAVTKVEFAGGSCMVREAGLAPADGMSAMHMCVNRNKRSLLIDFSKQGAQELLQKLVAKADVFIEDFHPGDVERCFGISLQVARQGNPSLIYAAMSSYGTAGPAVGESGAEELLQARSGMAAYSPSRDGSSPMTTPHQLAGKTAGFFLAIAVTAALSARCRGAGGQDISLNKLDCITMFNSPDTFMNDFWLNINPNPPAPGKLPRMFPLSSIYRLFDCKDVAQGFTFLAVSDKEFEAAAKALNKPEWLLKQEWRTLPGRIKDLEKCFNALAAAPKDFTRDEVCARLREAEIAHARVLSPAEVMTCEQTMAMGAVHETSKPGIGAYRLWRVPAQFAATPASTVRRPAPLRGEGGDEALRVLGGMVEADIEDFIAEGVVVPAAAPVLLQAPRAPRFSKRASAISSGSFCGQSMQPRQSARENHAWPGANAAGKVQDKEFTRRGSGVLQYAV